jgi:hypothetical protein
VNITWQLTFQNFYQPYPCAPTICSCPARPHASFRHLACTREGGRERERERVGEKVGIGSEVGEGGRDANWKVTFSHPDGPAVFLAARYASPSPAVATKHLFCFGWCRSAFFSLRLDLVLNLSPPCSQPLCLSPPLNACLCAQAGAATLHGCDDFLATEKGVRMPRNLIVIPMVTLRSCRATWGIHRPTSFGTHRRKKSSKMQSNPRSDQCTPLHRKMAA